MKNKILPVIFVGLLFVLIFVSACTETSQSPVSLTPGQSPDVPVNPRTSETPGASVTTEIPATTITSGNPDCSSGQARCDGSCVDTQSNSQHCGACENVCNKSEPCSEGTCLSWTGSWINVFGEKYELTQTGTLVNGTDSYHQVIVSGSTSGYPPRFSGTYTHRDGSSYSFTYDMALDGKSYTGRVPGCNILTYTREHD